MIFQIAQFLSILTFFKSIDASPLPKVITRYHTADAVTTTQTYTTGTTTVHLPPVEIFISNGVTYTFTLTDQATATEPTTTTLVYQDTTSSTNAATTEDTTEATTTATTATAATTPTTSSTKATTSSTKATTSSTATTLSTKATTSSTKATTSTQATTSSTSTKATTSSTSTKATTSSTKATTATTPTTTSTTPTTSKTSTKATTSLTSTKATSTSKTSTSTKATSTSTTSTSTSKTSTSTSKTSTSTSSTKTASSTSDDTSETSASSSGTYANSIAAPSVIVYSPYTDAGGCKDADAIQTDLDYIYSKGIKRLRVYGADCASITEVLPRSAKLGIKVNQGFWFGLGEIDSIDDDVDTVIEYGQENGWDVFDFITVGNEAINDDFCTLDELIDKIASVKSKLRDAGYEGFVTTSEPPVSFLDNPSLCTDSEIDFVGINPHSYFNAGVYASEAGTFVVSQQKLVEAACGSKSVFITETGYPHKGDTNGLNVPSTENQYEAIKSIIAQTDGNVTILTTYDDLWKPAGDYGVEQYFGAINLFK